MSDAQAIIYGRPRYLAPLLIVAVAGAVAGAVIAFLTYGRVDTASTSTVLGNRAVTSRLAADETRREVEDLAHRKRNEEAHACQLWLDQKILALLGDKHTYVQFADPDPCATYPQAGAVPPVVYPTTTTTTRHATTAPRTRRQSPTTTTTTRPATTTHPTTTTTANPCPTGTVPVARLCRPVSGP